MIYKTEEEKIITDKKVGENNYSKDKNTSQDFFFNSFWIEPIKINDKLIESCFLC